ncbi:MAG: chitobiase/beta-hexosaminidase C-terminal domain-containing protein, partial [Clostridiales bacterium]|nr:chitobiase/beta-hexosaminidase C-terminal domain-containing protein [Clostridiales bacterium]
MTKTNTRSRIVSILLVLMMLLTMVPITAVTANAADDTSYTQAEIRNYYTFASYLRSHESRDLKLMEDIDYTVGINDLSIDVIRNQKLDLNGHKITINASRRAGFENLLCIRRGEFTLYDSKGGGELAVSFPNDDKAYSIIMMSSEKKDEPAKFTMNGGTLTKLHPNMTYTYGASGCIGDDYFNKPENGKRSQITINGGTINCPYDWDRSQSLLDFPVEAMPLALQLLYSNLTINGGTFNGIVWTDTLWRGEQDTEPRVVLNGGEFNSPFVVEGMQKDATQIVIDGAHFKDGFHVNNGYSINTDVGTVPVLLLKSGVFDSPDKNPKLDIYNVTANSYGNGVNPDATARAKLEMILHAMKCFPNSAIKVNGKFYTSENIASLVGKNNDDFYLKLNSSTPIEVIRDAWGVMKSVTLDGDSINYAKDWYGGFEEMDNSTAHTLKFEWYPLAQELKDAGYSYLTKCEHYISGSTAVQQTDTIAADKTSHTITIPAGADPKVYSYDLHLNLQKDGSNIGIFSNEHIVKLVVNQAPPEPPAPVAHSIKIVNTFGTATPSTAMAGETITVKAKDRTADNMMFTQWYTETAGVTFADATKQETTFVMPDCDVKVNPGFQQVSFRKQPTDSWLSSVDDSKVYFAFSQPITSWKLVNENDQTLASGDAESANALVAATLGPKPDKTEMTCRVIVTSNGQNFTSNEFTLKWYNVPGAPDVTVYPEGGKFVETLDVNLKTPNTYWGILYTTDGSDPYDKSGETWTKNPKAIEESDSTRVTINKDTTIKACLYNSEGYSNMEKFGDIVTCDFTKVELTPPVADPVSGTSFYDRLNVSLSTDIVNAKIMWSYDDLDVDDLGNPGKWKEYEPEKESITLSGSYGMHGFYALTGIRMEHPDGYTYWVHSDKQDYSYPRITYATIADASVTGKVNEEINPVDVSITLSGDVFAEELTAGTDVSSWFTNRPDGLKATVKEKTNYTKTLVITISGTPTATSAAAISVEMPKSALRYTGTGTAIELTVLSNSNAVYNIGTDAVHTHDYTGQPYLYLDPGNHYQECKAGDGYNIQAHDFSAWTKVDDTNHSRTCSKCKKSGETANYTETAEHTWVWVVDQEAALNQPGKQHEECTGCHAKRSENTEIPALRDYAVTVTGGTATVAAGTPITRAMEGVEITITAQAPDGKHFVKWVVKAGGVTLANETSATTTFTMPANDVTIEAECAENPVESYTLTVIKGTASVAAGTPITDKIEQNTVVTVKADAPETGKVFDKWVVLEGGVTLTDATKATTTFTMPGNAVKIEATYKDAPPAHTHSYGTEWKYDGTNHWHECECGDKADTAAHSFQWVIDKAATK